MNVERLFRPESIAVIGASQTEGKIGYEAMANAVEFGGRVYPVNPSGSGTVFGEAFVESVADVDDRVDLALLCVPAPVVPDVLEECGRADVGGAVIYAGGFAEADEDGERLQAEITDIAARHDLALLGPNTSGFVVPSRDLFASFAGGVERMPPGDVAIVAQSGGVAHTLAFQAMREGRGVSAMVGLGNRANVGFEEAVSFFDGDEETGAIVLHVEGTDRGRQLMETCREATTPVAAYKVGQSDVGDFAESHTGALTGDHELYEAGFAQYGVPTVDSTLALFDAGEALAKSPPPAGGNVGVVTAQAGPGIIVADRVQRGGGTLPDLGEETRERVGDILPGITYAGNPVDTGRPMPEFGEVVTAVAEDDAVDVVLVFELFEEALGFPVETLDGLADRVGKPVLFATEGPVDATEDELRALRDAGVPTFTSPERAADAAALLARFADFASTDGSEEVSADV
ncbi:MULTISPECIES: acetate--CoA ligase family protein [Halorussus]|uniref:acetate--CoA ligase family protein n=1 Tax=Halorussus TaxID=1070314 RepID=UPI0020A1980D|nr:CoA-binding protein [Halorussus vallis]USZ77800.1 CoA-binding protein [Halorussus vallis]